MKRFVEGVDRSQSVLFPERLDDYIDDDNPVRIVDVFVDEPDLGELGFDGVTPAVTNRPGYQPARCSRSISTAISIASLPAADWSARRSATWS